MAPKGMTFGQSWMIEVIVWVSDHSNTFHDSPRAEVCRNCERHDFRQGKRLKSEGQHCRRAFTRISAAPEFHGKSPADLCARRKMRFETRFREANETSKRRHARNFYGPQAPTVPFNVSFDPIGQPSLSCLERSAGKYSMTRASALSLAKGTRSAATHCLRLRRAVRSSVGMNGCDRWSRVTA
jgi:hypothetical protein